MRDVMRPGQTRWSPAQRRRRLAQRLRDLRARDGRPAHELADILGWSKTKITRWENGQITLPKPAEIARLLDVYDVAPDERAEIEVLVDQARQRDWWYPHRHLLDPDYVSYLGLEAEASILRQYSPLRIPELLRTPAYQRHICRAESPDSSDDDLDDLINFHDERRRFMFDGPQPVHLHAIITEAALRRSVGDQEVMRAQLKALLEHSSPDNVVLQVVPDSAGALPLAAPFVMITFLEPTDPEAIYTTSAAGSHWIEDPADIVRVETAYERLVRVSLPVVATRRLIRAYLDALA